MPQILVTRTGRDYVDWEGFASALNQLVAEKAAAPLETCKTQVVRGEDVAVGADIEGRDLMVDVAIGLLAGRTDETKAELTEAVVDLLRKFIGPEDGYRMHVSAEVRDLDPSYRNAEF
ncbi:5-carboxymethyl-2-hydroxymuconate Delta-isomerase [Streptomyces sp. NPDC056528]|uniref:5-carboxymethyl-2-hydroxymuconate Delta-isomerase n=1 Tax=Streptomyces sp. NPDC056528 TaxID=3345854 RepID=UPI0036A8FC30